MEKLLKYFIEDTAKKIDELNEDLQKINEKLDDLVAFKIEMLTTAKMTSLLVSGLMSLITFVVTIVVSYYAGAR